MKNLDGAQTRAKEIMTRLGSDLFSTFLIRDSAINNLTTNHPKDMQITVSNESLDLFSSGRAKLHIDVKSSDVHPFVFIGKF